MLQSSQRIAAPAEGRERINIKEEDNMPQIPEAGAFTVVIISICLMMLAILTSE